MLSKEIVVVWLALALQAPVGDYCLANPECRQAGQEGEEMGIGEQCVCTRWAPGLIGLNVPGSLITSILSTIFVRHCVC